MKEIATIGLDPAKNVVQIHGVDAIGIIHMRQRVGRAQVLLFFSRLPPCLVGKEACAGAHYWSRDLARFDHDLRLIPPSFVKRCKTDAADAEAICEASTRQNTRFVPVKTERQQAQSMQYRRHDFLVRKLTQLVNAIRAHRGELGIVAPKGVHSMAASLPSWKRPICRPRRECRSICLPAGSATRSTASMSRPFSSKPTQGKYETACCLQTVPGNEPITAIVLAATLPDVASFRSARNFPSWSGFTPKPHSSGGKERLGSIPKMGNRHIRRLPYPGAMGVISARKRSDVGINWVRPSSSWLLS